MNKTLKRILWILGALAFVAFIAFLYLIPPFTMVPQETFIAPARASGPSTDTLADPAMKLLADRGRYLVHVHGCSDCHTPQGDQGPKLNEFLAGGNVLGSKADGASVSANLTSDKETGLGNVEIEIIKRAIRSGIHHTGRSINYRAMPWGGFSQLSEEDLHAVAVYLKMVKGVTKRIPAPSSKLVPADAPISAEFFLSADTEE
jgi:mono/diheme cytochrome c family protein